MTSSDKHKLKDNLTCLTPQLTFHLSTSESPKIKTTVLNSPIHFGDTFKSTCKKPCFFFVKIDKIQPFTTHYVHLSILCCSKTSISLTIDKSTGTFEEDYQIVVFYYTKQNKSKSKTIKSKLWGVENPKSILKCHSLSKYL